ncbi:hypothetical protein JCM10908_004101 [Rhodotorula pacifica]|uniref:uncharacterized protein n=1 Tax=Rhodotorula pacifica TaxID=1495444 RepID=UPI00317A1507
MSVSGSGGEIWRVRGGAGLSERKADLAQDGIARALAPSSLAKTALTYTGSPLPSPAPPAKTTLSHAERPAINANNAPATTAKLADAAGDGPSLADMTLGALVAADRSASTSSSFSREYVESWRAAVEVSEDDISLSAEALLDATPRAQQSILQTDHQHRQTPASPAGPASNRLCLVTADTDRHTQDAGQMEEASLKGLPFSRQNVRSTSTQEEAFVARVPKQQQPANQPPSSSQESQRRAAKFGRDRTNESVDTHSQANSDDSASTIRKVTKPKSTKGAAITQNRKKRAQNKAEVDLTSETEQDRKEKARAKWKEIDDYQLDTVYTL